MTSEINGLCPSWALAVGYLGVASSVVLCNFGSAWGTWKSGVSLLHTGIRHPHMVMKNVIPIVMSGVIGIYGLIVAIIISADIPSPTNERVNAYSIFTAMGHLASGLCCGMCGFVAGLSIGVIGDVGIRSVGYHAGNITVFSMMPIKVANNNNNNNNHSEALPLKLAPWGKENDDDNNGQGANSSVIPSEGQNKLFVGMMVMLIFSEALALYGLIVALIVSQNTYECV